MAYLRKEALVIAMFHTPKASSNAEVVRILIDAGANVKAHNSNGDTPLHKACKDGFADIVEMLINAGAGINIADDCGRTPLHNASLYQHKKIIKILLAAGANILVQDDQHLFPLDYYRMEDKEIKDMLGGSLSPKS